MSELVSLKVMRAMRNMSQLDLSVETGICQASISHYERGRKDPSDYHKKILEEALRAKGRIDWSSK